MTTEIKKDALAFIVSCVFASSCACAAERIENPYADVPWDKTEYLHSFSHQHGQNPQIFWDMGYRHLPLSNYYPSQPFYPLPEAFTREHPDALGGPNAEQHGFSDSGIHFNAIGSLYATGYGYTPSIKAGTAPIEQVFRGLNAYNPRQTPWRGIYRLDLEFAPAGAGGGAAAAALTVEGATRVNWGTFAPVGDGNMRELQLTGKSPKSFYLKALSDSIRVKVGFDPALTKITKFRMMQGINRPWRDAVRAALDGTLDDAQGKRIEGLLYPDAGGLTINHPTCGLEAMLTLLDFDPRVLGIEVWNQHVYFGGKLDRPDAMPLYELWDDVLRTGRRCYGFFVKDHFLFGRGRNVLLVSGLEGLTAREKEREALRAYRTGRFFGLLGAMSVDASGKVVPPYDNSAFRFTRIAVRQDARGEPSGVDVAVTGADRAKRPHTQIRFVTDKGVVRAEKGESAFFPFPRDAAGAISCRFVRVEAFAYPPSHLNGKPLTHDAVAAMNVFQIACLHDRVGDLSRTEIYARGEEPIGIADMIFAQPILVRR